MPLPHSHGSADTLTALPVICSGVSEVNRRLDAEGTLKDLIALATHMTPQIVEAEQAAATMSAVETKLLIQSINTVRPLLGYLTRAIASAWVDQSDDGSTGYEETTHFSQGGIVLSGSLYERVGGRDDACGPVVGEALVLWDDGTLSEVTTSGSWTRWANGARAWNERRAR